MLNKMGKSKKKHKAATVPQNLYNVMISVITHDWPHGHTHLSSSVVKKMDSTGEIKEEKKKKRQN